MQSFKEMLTYFREKSGLTKTDLARHLNVSPNYIMNIEKGHKPPPRYGMCKQIASALKLSDEERSRLYKAAFADRLDPEDAKFLSDSHASAQQIVCENKPFYITREIAEALTDPIAVQGLLLIHGSSEDIKRAIREFVERIPELDPAKRDAVLALVR